VHLDAGLAPKRASAFNVVGRLPANAPGSDPATVPSVVIGAHYDHLGFGGHGSLAPDSADIHAGADDNASGTATLLELAKTFAARTDRKADLWFIAFSGEESGVLGSSAFVRAPPAGFVAARVRAMLNLDMVGRMRANALQALGTASAAEWDALLSEACKSARVNCTGGGDGYGPSDQTPFYAAGIPVLHFFTGAHGDYHKPSDLPPTLNAGGMARVAEVVAKLVDDVGGRATGLTLRTVPSPVPMGDRRSFGAALGTIPDYTGAPNGAAGVLLAGVRPGGGADLGGLQRGDLLVRLGKITIGSVQDLMFVLGSAKPGETVTAEVVRNGEHLTRSVTFQESKGR